MNNTRFAIIGAETMFDLYLKMNTVADPRLHVIYFGRNEGDYSNHEQRELLENAKFIAVFDMAPLQTYLIEDLQIIVNPDTSSEESDENKLAIAA